MTTKLNKTADRPLQSPRVIVCEGADEYDILLWIRHQRGLGDDAVELIDAKGRTRLPTVLGDLRFQSGGSGVQLVTVVMDAEEQSASDRVLVEQLEAIARAQGFAYLSHVLPDARSAGALETLIRRHADTSVAASSCADDWERCLSPSVETRTVAQKDKAWGHVWLAGQGAFHSRLGHALAHNAEIRSRLPAVVQHFESLMDEVLSAPLS